MFYLKNVTANSRGLSLVTAEESFPSTRLQLSVPHLEGLAICVTQLDRRHMVLSVLHRTFQNSQSDGNMKISLKDSQDFPVLKKRDKNLRSFTKQN